MIVSIVKTIYVDGSALSTIGFERRSEAVDMYVPFLKDTHIKNGVPHPAVLVQDPLKPYSCIIFYLNDHGLLSVDDHIDYFDEGVYVAGAV